MPRPRDESGGPGFSTPGRKPGNPTPGEVVLTLVAFLLVVFVVFAVVSALRW